MSTSTKRSGVLDLPSRLNKWLYHYKGRVPKHCTRKVIWDKVQFSPLLDGDVYTSCTPLPIDAVVDKSEFECENTGGAGEQQFEFKVRHSSRFRFQVDFETLLLPVERSTGSEILIPLLAPPELQEDSRVDTEFVEKPTPQPNVAHRVLRLRGLQGAHEAVEHVTTHEVSAHLTVKENKRMRVITEVSERSFKRNFTQKIRISGKIVVQVFKDSSFQSGYDIGVPLLFKDKLKNFDMEGLEVEVGESDVVLSVSGTCMCQMTGRMKTRTEEVEPEARASVR